MATAASTALAGANAQVQLLVMASQASGRPFVWHWTDARRPLHVLVNNVASSALQVTAGCSRVLGWRCRAQRLIGGWHVSEFWGNIAVS